MPNIPARITVGQDNLLVGLPLTNPTGKIRVKRRAGEHDFGQPFSARQNPIDANCYIEWQIGYDNEKSTDPEVVKEIWYEKERKKKYAYELTVLLYRGLQAGIFTLEGARTLLEFANSVGEQDFIENRYGHRISRTVTAPQVTIKNITLIEIEEKYPVLLYSDKQGFVVEVVLKHKQRAVGYQPMIYVSLPLEDAEGNIVGIKAEPNEFATFRVTRENNNFVHKTFEIFSIASKRHNEDVKSLLNAVITRIG
jgi:hypothetical protein